MTLGEWVADVPASISGDPLWKVEAYRLALFASDVCWFDLRKLMRDLRTHSRGSARDRARFYEYALGSARESRDWYFKARHVLGNDVCEHRLELLTQIIRLLLTMVPQQRSYKVGEAQDDYRAQPLGDGEGE